MNRSRKGLSMLEVIIASVIMVVIAAIALVILSSASSQASNESANMVMQEKARKLIDDISAELRMASSASVVGSNALQLGTFTDSTNNQVTPIDPLSGPAGPTPTIAQPWYGNVSGTMNGFGTAGTTAISPAAKCPLNTNSTHILAGYARWSKLQFDTMGSTSATTSGAPVNSYDFTGKAPSYTKRIAYTLALDNTNIGATETVDGLDNNNNGLIDERILWRQEVVVPATIPAPPTATPWPTGTAIMGRSLRNVAFEIPNGTPKNRIIIHVMFQGVDSKGKLIWYYTNSTVTLRN